MESRTLPNILITGTPGTGKTTLSEELAKLTNLNYISVNKVAADNDFYDGYDEENQCHILDEDRIVDEIEPLMSAGGQILEYHSCDYFPERWFDAVFVLRTNNDILFPRLKQRNYPEKKILDLVHCEIVQVLLDEARESYAEEVVHELPSNSLDDLQLNIKRIEAWIKQWLEDNAKSK